MEVVEPAAAESEGSSESSEGEFTNDLLDVLDEDVLAADFLMSLASAASNSYRFHTVFRPYPQVPGAVDGEGFEEANNRLVSWGVD